ncbi:hypothetical protein ES705_45223 [subsurface metagenome]
MFLTRFGFGSKVIINGDITQVDLPLKEHSGLTRVAKILKKIKGIEFIYLNDLDVVRHSNLINAIILSEIIAPPRALKPYDFQRYKRLR